jgi:hypothetical protein
MAWRSLLAGFDGRRVGAELLEIAVMHEGRLAAIAELW